MEMRSITREEVARAIQEMKNGKAAGEDEITVEMIKAGGDAALNWLWKVIKIAWTTQQIPKDWSRGTIVVIFKKGDRKKCSNYRGITLLSQCVKIYERAIERRLREDIETKLNEQNYGFREGRGTVDLIFSIRQIMEKRWEEGRKMFMVFLDLEKAYDHLPREKVWECQNNQWKNRMVQDKHRS
jgi:hypothetical protein